jgi:hypothetical protein
MHTFSHVSTQYEIESWIFPHPGVTRLQDERNPKLRGHSLHSMNPLKTPPRKREERPRLRKRHQKWRSNEYQVPHNALKRKKENKIKEGSMRTLSLKTTVERSGACAQSQHCDSTYYVPSEKVSSGHSKGDDAGARPTEFLSNMPSSYFLHTQPWIQTQSTLLPWLGHGPTAQMQLLLHPPTCSHQQPSAAAPRSHHRAELKGLLLPLSCKSWTMGAESVPLGGTGESHINNIH